MSGDGGSRSIDSYAKNKFNALKDYASRHPGTKWGFVRAVGTSLYLSNTEWTEDMFDSNVWKTIQEFIH